jgi:putative Mg2+ transporter-C (MgtC) family protein
LKESLVLNKESLTVRGLTTAASIWVTAAIGILLGIGFYFAATVAVILTLGTLSVFRWIETKMPTLFYAHYMVRFSRDAIIPVEELRALFREYGFTVASLSYRLDAEGNYFECRTVIRTIREDNARRLAVHLASRKDCLEFRISPAEGSGGRSIAAREVRVS